MTLEITFWGVRGSTPVSGPLYEQGGGNTSCVSVLINQKQFIIFDAGSGLCNLYNELRQLPLKTVYLFLSHLHLDHVLGLPFFKPMWDKQYTIYLYSIYDNLKEFLDETLLCPPLFPVKLGPKNAQLIFHHIANNGEIIITENILMKTTLLNHPGGSVGYRLEADGKAICYITDVEHDPKKLDQNLIRFIEGSDLFIYDSSYTEEEFQEKKGWGHSTHVRAAELAKMADVKQLALFHHDPSHDDTLLLKMECEARKIFEQTFVAQQGLKMWF